MEPLAVLALAVAGLGIGTVVIVRRLRDRAFHEVLADVGRENVVRIESVANAFRGRRRGFVRVRGNGCLCLTRTELLFQRWLPRHRLAIPLSHVREVALVDPGRGSATSRFLRLQYDEGGGETETLGFAVPEVSAWHEALSALASDASAPTRTY